MARASSGSRSSINSIDPLMSANSAVTVLRSSSVAGETSCCSDMIRISGPVDPVPDAGVAAGMALPASALPQSSQNSDAGAFSELHFGQLFESGLPHAAQNFLPVLLSVPHFEQRIAFYLKERDTLFLNHGARTATIAKAWS
jgi:hypothetical protein